MIAYYRVINLATGEIPTYSEIGDDSECYSNPAFAWSYDTEEEALEDIGNMIVKDLELIIIKFYAT